jgi:hypothetical protein
LPHFRKLANAIFGIDDLADHAIRTGNIEILFFSLGMSWLSGRVLYKSPWSAMLDSVKASVLGLGGIDCASFYPGCDLEKERTKRRRRRKK